MDGRSEEIFEAHQDAILAEAASRYGIKPENLNRLGSFESMVFEYNSNGGNHILKITHSLHRTPDQVRGELDWTGYLLNHGVSVSRTAPSVRGGLLEVIDGRSIDALGDDYFLVYALDKANGRQPESSEWSDGLFRNWGRIVGRMNALAKEYLPGDPAWKRFEWYEDNSLKVEKYIPKIQAWVIERCREQINHMRAWPTDRDSYGLIHSDMHHSNFVVDNGRITAFDFDDCHYSWFGFDLAIPLFYALRDHRVNPDDVEFARRFLGNFLDGYRRENDIDGVWIKRIPDFMKLREIDLYSVIHAEGAAEVNGWCRRFMVDRQKRIETNVPVIEMDFSEFA